MRVIRRCRPKKPIQLLRYPGAFHLTAAEGWLEFGNPAEALSELDQIARGQRLHPDVMQMRWRIFASLRDWKRCLVIARALVERSPNDSRSWIVLAKSLHRSGKLLKAHATAVRRVVDFPECWQLHYDAACYACLLGRKDEAEEFLYLAMTLGDAKVIGCMAPQEPDLAALWQPSE